MDGRNYNLLQSIDPTKINVPISDRFAKLTLSSNKKKQQQQNDPELHVELQRRQEKRNSISRNISKQFEMENTEVKKTVGENPLLRSESSKDTERENSNDLCGVGEQNDELTMDPLHVSEDYENPTQLEEDVDLLTQKVSSLAVDSAPISISSGSTDNLVSAESQCSSTSAENHLHIVHHIPINVKDALKQDTISLNLTSSIQNDDVDKTYEMTEDEDEEEEAITISDTSESQHDQEPDVMATSSIPSCSSQTSGLLLPCLTDDKAERVAAFLRDVSIERRAMIEECQTDINDTVERLIDKGEINKIQETSKRPCDIASADTESMTPDGAEGELTPKPLIERDRRMQVVATIKDKKIKSDDNAEILTEEKSDILKDHNVIETNLPKSVHDKNQFGEEKTPRNLANKKTNIYKLSRYETESDLDFSISELVETPKISTKFKSDTPQENVNNSRRLANTDTEENTILSPFTESTSKSPTTANSVRLNLYDELSRVYEYNDENNPHRLANADTMTNSAMTEMGGAIMYQEYDHTKDYKTPERSNKTPEINFTPPTSKCSGSIISFSSENNGTLPEESIVISETDDEQNVEHEQASPQTINSDDNKKLSNSFQNNDDTSSSSCNDSQSNQNGHMSRLQMSMASINISAKINIKIHIPSRISIESNENDEHYDPGNKAAVTQEENISNKASERLERQTGKEIKNRDQSLFCSSNASVSPTQCIQMQNVQKESVLNYSKKCADSVEVNKATVVEEEGENISNQYGEQLEKETRKESENHNQSLSYNSNHSVSPTTCNQIQKKFPEENVLNCSDKSSGSVEVIEDEKFLTEAQRLLNQLYGKSWQTPEVIRTLKRTSKSGDKKSNNTVTSSKREYDRVKNFKDPKSGNKSMVEETILDDFSIFRRNIVKTNLDSTRLAATPKTPAVRERCNKEVRTEPRTVKTLRNKTERIRATPSTVGKPSQQPIAKVVTNRRRGVVTGHWRQFIDDDSDSEGANASDDDDADVSWSKNASDIEKDLSDSDYENSPKSRKRNKRINTTTTKRSNKSYELAKRLNESKEGELVYLDLSKEEVEIQEEVPKSPPANHDVTFASRLQDILKTCRHEDKAKLPSSSAKKSKRKLFTPNFGDDDLECVIPSKEEGQVEKDVIKSIDNKNEEDEILDHNNCPFDSQGRPKILELFNKPLEVVKVSKPIFQLTPSPKKKNIKGSGGSDGCSTSSGSATKSKTDNEVFKTPLSVKSKASAKFLQNINKTPEFKYSFLKSLDVTVSKSFCHPDALYYRDNYRLKKEELSKILYDMYNEKLFGNKLNVPIMWNKKLSNTAGRCLNRKRMGVRSCTVELSIKVLTSADRLRCTLIHELCHAATWIFNGEGGHGHTWKVWARRANDTFPEIPKIGVCHQYDIEYKYTYKCTLCGAKSHAHSKSKKVENIRCSYCHGAIEIFLNKKDKDGNILPTPVKEPTGFAKFVKDNYKKFKRDDLKHADVMKLLSNEFASIKVVGN